MKKPIENIPGHPTVWEPISFFNYEVDKNDKKCNKKKRMKMKKNKLSAIFKRIRNFFTETATFANTFYV
ncbi:hypothetical protein CLV86_2522 [Lacinutrix venerupis]|uniref:Uncharacterized protein n=1 Tax=Lacinutrix venerupis TaxID=1486034 RepID=A0AAC9LMW4_9FLAO|nr:hypothetical protein [Lacinutrix venerupis]APY01369.1 hypothetical protein BWR22_14015 [Lacinutrix venerupis]RLJ61501.1 hypothetical protein CLV86_2522 [Lacinutrix venerupis]